MCYTCKHGYFKQNICSESCELCQRFSFIQRSMGSCLDKFLGFRRIEKWLKYCKILVRSILAYILYTIESTVQLNPSNQSIVNIDNPTFSRATRVKKQLSPVTICKFTFCTFEAKVFHKSLLRH